MENVLALSTIKIYYYSHVQGNKIFIYSVILPVDDFMLQIEKSYCSSEARELQSHCG
jgi:hypothetical protein